MSYDPAGNLISDTRPDGTFAFTYDAAGRLNGVHKDGVQVGSYRYNTLGQMIRRETPGTGQVIHVLHDLDGSRLAEYDAATGLPLIEYIWLEGEAVAAVIGGATYFLRSDHIGRPVLATDEYGAVVQTVSYKPFGAVAQVQSAGVPLGLDLRFPGQFAQWETGLHQNWMRDYDPTTGRYIQADPLGLVDGASVYGYALQSPGREWAKPGGLCL